MGSITCISRKDATSRCYNATGGAPLAAAPDRFTTGMAVRGPHRVSTPGLLAGIGAMHAAHGRLPWRELCGPAIEHAREGFAVTQHYRDFADAVRPVLAADRRSRAVFLGDLDVGVPPTGALVRQPDLASTLDEIADDGADTFYRGRLAKRLAAGMREAGVLVDERDLEAFQPQLQEPIGISYREFHVTQTPPNSTGFTLLQMLKIAERFDLAALDPVRRIHVLVEARNARSSIASATARIRASAMFRWIGCCRMPMQMNAPRRSIWRERAMLRWRNLKSQ